MELVGRQVALMRRQVDHHLARAGDCHRLDPGARTDVLPVLRDLERTLARIYADKALAIELARPPELAFRGARQDLEEMLGNLLDNACKWAAANVTVRAEAAAEQVLIAIEDDGPACRARDVRKSSSAAGASTSRCPAPGLASRSPRTSPSSMAAASALDGAAAAGGLRALLILLAAETLATRRASQRQALRARRPHSGWPHNKPRLNV